ncbi:hypothetical protein P6144_07705 [Sphingomonas sp. HITSZ_GF]|uniref:hypothetical protein n=1 Tax=Sphingomonas sp. HITSZ_GF TaxID=3037247 RepID=UPI00240D0C6B|nr:hypothetical protein [Sphingomonas sp. HITSZ_GF]MDG2533525.1 hypothetical protein [Sphingomonas sp. HITSZ_GF]
MKTKFRSAAALFACLCAVPAQAQYSYANEDARPLPPAGSTPNQLIPAHGGDGGYMTVNRGISREQTAWHVRAALNVAALGCRDEAERETVAAYNALLSRHKASLAAADFAVKAQYRTRYGAGWDSRHDRDMTRVYNFFAQPPAQTSFCRVARDVLAEARRVSPDQFAAFAADALPRLEAPFTDFYRDYEAWKVADRAWQGRLARR